MDIDNQDNIRSLITNRYRKIPGENLIIWGIASGIMILFAGNFNDNFSMTMFLLAVCTVSGILTVWLSKKDNKKIDMNHLTYHQRSSLWVMVSFLLFGIILTVTFRNNALSVFVNPLWMFNVGVLSYAISVFFFTNILRYYSLSLIMLALLIMVYFTVATEYDPLVIQNILRWVSFVAISCGYICVGIVLLLRQRKI